mgnify:CR=1 FL=1
MKAVIQRVKNADVKVDGQTIGEIGKGFMVLIGVSNSDTKEIADKLKYPVYDNTKDRMIHDDDRLYNHGWAHITRSLLGAHEYTINWTQHLTSEQKGYLRPIFEDDNISIDIFHIVFFIVLFSILLLF